MTNRSLHMCQEYHYHHKYDDESLDLYDYDEEEEDEKEDNELDDDSRDNDEEDEEKEEEHEERQKFQEENIISNTRCGNCHNLMGREECCVISDQCGHKYCGNCCKEGYKELCNKDGGHIQCKTCGSLKTTVMCIRNSLPDQNIIWSRRNAFVFHYMSQQEQCNVRKMFPNLPEGKLPNFTRSQLIRYLYDTDIYILPPIDKKYDMIWRGSFSDHKIKVEDFAYEVCGYDYFGQNYGVCMTLFPYHKALIVDKIKRHVRKHVKLSMICKELEIFPTYSHLLPPCSNNVDRLSATLERIVPELASHDMNIPDHHPEQNLFRDIREAGKLLKIYWIQTCFFMYAA